MANPWTPQIPIKFQETCSDITPCRTREGSRGSGDSLRCGKHNRHHGSDMFGPVDAHHTSEQARKAVNERKT